MQPIAKCLLALALVALCAGCASAASESFSTDDLLTLSLSLNLDGQFKYQTSDVASQITIDYNSDNVVATKAGTSLSVVALDPTDIPTAAASALASFSLLAFALFGSLFALNSASAASSRSVLSFCALFAVVCVVIAAAPSKAADPIDVTVTVPAGFTWTNIAAEVDDDSDVDLHISNLRARTASFKNDGRGHFLASAITLVGNSSSLSVQLADGDINATGLAIADYQTTTGQFTFETDDGNFNLDTRSSAFLGIFFIRTKNGSLSANCQNSANCDLVTPEEGSGINEGSFGYDSYAGKTGPGKINALTDKGNGRIVFYI